MVTRDGGNGIKLFVDFEIGHDGQPRVRHANALRHAMRRGSSTSRLTGLQAHAILAELQHRGGAGATGDELAGIIGLKDGRRLGPLFRLLRSMPSFGPDEIVAKSPRTRLRPALWLAGPRIAEAIERLRPRSSKET